MTGSVRVRIAGSAFIALFGAGLALCAGAGAAAGQDLAERIDRAPDGVVHYRFPARPDVCGDGPSIVIRRDDGSGSTYGHWRGNGRWNRDACAHGPVHIALEKRAGELTDLDLRVAAPARGGGTDLGPVAAREAADWLLAAARTLPADPAEDAIFAAALAADVVVWPELLGLAREPHLDDGVRKAALFWLAQQAGDRIAAGIDGIARDDDTDLDVREHAVFALSQRDEEEAIPTLSAIALDSALHPRLRQKALFWLADFDDPRVVELFERILGE